MSDSETSRMIRFIAFYLVEEHGVSGAGYVAKSLAHIHRDLGNQSLEEMWFNVLELVELFEDSHQGDVPLSH